MENTSVLFIRGMLLEFRLNLLQQFRFHIDPLNSYPFKTIQLQKRLQVLDFRKAKIKLFQTFHLQTAKVSNV